MKIRNTFGGVGLFALSLTASALSLGQSQGQPVLGTPLDLVFQLQPDPGLDAASSCVAAEVVLGDRRIDASRVSIRPLSTREGQPAAVRVRASVMVDEPVVVVRLSAGCVGQMSRSYTFFAELPETVAPSSMPLDIAQLNASAAASAAREPAARPRPPAAPRAATRRAESPRTEASSAKPAPAPRPRKPPARPADVPVAPATSTAAAAPSESRLRMEPLDSWLGPKTGSAGATGAGGAAGAAAAPAAPPSPSSPAALGAPAAAVAASGAVATDPAASPAGMPELNTAEQRVRVLEAELQAFKAREARQNANFAEIRSQLDAMQQAQQSNNWTIPLLAALAIALAVLAWLLVRLRSLSQVPPNGWLNSINDRPRGGDAGGPDDTSDGAYRAGPARAMPAGMSVSSVPGAAFGGAAQAAAVSEFGPSTLRASMFADSAMMAVHRPREIVKPEDLFDVRQQAEFFTSVGEYEQAIAVLRKHIEEHQDSSPLAYLELLGLFYQLSRKTEFDALRQQFEQHFAARVPEMAQFAQRGRSLAHYPELLARIEALWPIDEVSELLEGFLFRDPGQDSAVLFDLEAFDDLLLLQAVARTTPAGLRGQVIGRTRTTPDTAAELTPVAAAAAVAAGGLDMDPLAGDAPWATLERASATAPALVPLPSALDVPPLSLEIPSDFEVPQAAFARSAPLSTESPEGEPSAVPSLLDIDLSDAGRFQPLDLPEVQSLPFDLEEFPKRPIVGSGVDQVVGFNPVDPKLPLPDDLTLAPWEQDDSPDSIFSAWNAARTEMVSAKPSSEDDKKDKPESGPTGP